MCWASSDGDEDDKKKKRNANSAYKTGIRKLTLGVRGGFWSQCSGFRVLGSTFVFVFWVYNKTEKTQKLAKKLGLLLLLSIYFGGEIIWVYYYYYYYYYYHYIFEVKLSLISNEWVPNTLFSNFYI
jgi:hypothetical protein